MTECMHWYCLKKVQQPTHDGSSAMQVAEQKTINAKGDLYVWKEEEEFPTRYKLLFFYKRT